MTGIAQGDQVFLCVVTGLTASLQVVDLKVLFAAADLTSPGVTLKDLQT
jgi:hypothetical protein